MSQLVSDDDPRIREMTAEEQRSLDRYFNVTTELTTLKRIYDAMTNAQEPNATVIKLGIGKIPKLERGDEASSSLQHRLSELEERRQDLKPRWWGEWEALSSGKSEPSTQK